MRSTTPSPLGVQYIQAHYGTRHFHATHFMPHRHDIPTECENSCVCANFPHHASAASRVRVHLKLDNQHRPPSTPVHKLGHQSRPVVTTISQSPSYWVNAHAIGNVIPVPVFRVSGSRIRRHRGRPDFAAHSHTHTHASDTICGWH